MNLDKVKRFSKKFMEREYKDEAPYFDIAWEIFQEVMEKEERTEKNFGDPVLRLPVVRYEGNDSVMAPVVIRAFYVLYSELEEEIESCQDSASLNSTMMEVLSRKSFSPEFSTRIVRFILENQCQ